MTKNPPPLRTVETKNDATDQDQWRVHREFFKSLAPAPNTTLWRYMDFTRYVALLDSSALYFSRADQFHDPFEGSYSKLNERLRPELYKLIPAKAQEALLKINQTARKWMYVNCWHASEYESAAMWSGYAPSHASIAIQTTYDRLRSELGEDVQIGQVRYIDYERSWSPEGNLFYPFFHKRLAFDHEKEVRAVIMDPVQDGQPAAPNLLVENPNLGQNRKVSLPGLIETARIAPTAPPWILSLVENVTRKYGYPFQVLRSNLDVEPTY